MRKRNWWILILLLLVIGYLLGPRPASSDYATNLPQVPADPASLSQYIQTKEAAHRIKPDNHARIVWASDSARQKTEYSIVYLHGFTATYAEGEPVHKNIAKKFNCNLFLARLAEHGIDTTEPMQQLTVDKYWSSVKEALAIGKQIGNKVILMGTSTGGSLALKLAAEYKDVYAVVLLSPNIEINDGSAFILNNPWGLQIANLILGSKYIQAKDTRPIYKQYWIPRYRIEAAVSLQELLETSMTEKTFQKITQPVLMLYYYKDEIHQDSTVRVSAMKEMFNHLGTPPDKKRALAMPNTGNHVIASYIKSNDIAGVEKEIEDFFKDVLKLSFKQ
jgi:esterase/lipase